MCRILNRSFLTACALYSFPRLHLVLQNWRDLSCILNQRLLRSRDNDKFVWSPQPTNLHYTIWWLFPSHRDQCHHQPDFILFTILWSIVTIQQRMITIHRCLRSSSELNLLRLNKSHRLLQFGQLFLCCSSIHSVPLRLIWKYTLIQSDSHRDLSAKSVLHVANAPPESLMST